MSTLNRVRVVWTGVDGSPWYSNFYTFAEEAGVAESRAGVDGLLLAWHDQISEQVTATRLGEVAQIDSATGNITGVTGGADNAVAMLDVGELLPRATQALVQIRTSTYIGGRNVQGRLFIPGLVEDANADGKLSGTYAGVFLAAYNAYLTSMSFSPCVFSRKNGVGVRITDAGVASEFSVLRSRRD